MTRKFSLKMSTRPTRQIVMFKANVAKSEFGENMQMVVGEKIRETATHITLENFTRSLETGKKSVRTYRKDRILNGKFGIQRSNF